MSLCRRRCLRPDQLFSSSSSTPVDSRRLRGLLSSMGVDGGRPKVVPVWPGEAHFNATLERHTSTARLLDPLTPCPAPPGIPLVFTAAGGGAESARRHAHSKAVGIPPAAPNRALNFPRIRVIRSSHLRAIVASCEPCLRFAGHAFRRDEDPASPIGYAGQAARPTLHSRPFVH